MITVQLDSSNYGTFVHLLSFLGIEEEVALVIDDEIRPLLCPGPLIDFRFTRSIRKRYTRTPSDRNFSSSMCVAMVRP